MGRFSLVDPEEQAELSKKSFVLAMQRLLASARALASDGSSALMDDPLQGAEEDQAAAFRVVFFEIHCCITGKCRKLYCLLSCDYSSEFRERAGLQPPHFCVNEQIGPPDYGMHWALF
jgi:hypothetical protein